MLSTAPSSDALSERGLGGKGGGEGRGNDRELAPLGLAHRLWTELHGISVIASGRGTAATTQPRINPDSTPPLDIHAVYACCREC